MLSDTLVKESLVKDTGIVAEDEKVSKRDSQLDSKAEGAKHVKDTTQPMHVGWRGTLCWSGFIVFWYFILQHSVTTLLRSDTNAAAREDLFKEVPPIVYHYSEAAFFTSSVLGFINLIFEDTPDKKQLALLSVVIKGLSWHSDHLITSGRGVIKRDHHGVLYVPSRYVQWSCSTPTIIFTMSRISSLTAQEVATTMMADWLMVVTGWLASETPFLASVVFLAVSFACFGYVVRRLWRMLGDALAAADTQHSKNCLWFTLGSTTVVWNLFWVAWLVSHAGFSGISIWGEKLTIFCNFAAKILFSTSIMYNNFLTLAERRKAVQAAKEHSDRVQAVRDLSTAVRSKDSFLEVVGHELRTPLNAILQLSSALVVGAAGPLSLQAREWLTTIKGSAGHLLGVVNDILAFRATQATTLHLNQELVNVGQVIDEVMRQLLPSAGPNMQLEKVVHARLPYIVCDRRRLSLALSSLVANAIKFMDKPGGRVTVKAYPDRGGRHVVIKVIDNGPGMTPEQLATVAQPSMKQINIDISDANSSRKKKAGGLGLGLPITHQLIAAHGGVLRITSPGTGQGCTALIRLPVLQAVTNIDLKDPFTLQYSAMGYNLDQLLSPELASAENRACPVFSQVTPQGYGNGGMGRASSSASSMIPAGVNLSAMPSIDTSASASGRLTPPGNASLASAQMKQAAATLFAPMHLPAQAIPGTRPSAMSCGSSIDLSSNVLHHTYKWPPGSSTSTTLIPMHQGMMVLPSSGHGPMYEDTAAAAGGGGGGGGGISRPSEDSLAQWEEYAERMGYTAPAGMSFVEARATTGQNAVHNLMMDSMPSGGVFSGTNLYTVEPVTSAAASAHGVPGAAVALMSSLYSTDPAPAAGGAVKHGGGGSGKYHRGFDAVVRGTPIRDSIEEVDDECAEPEDLDLGNTKSGLSKGGNASVNAEKGRSSGGAGSGSDTSVGPNTGVRTPLARSGYMGRSSDVSSDLQTDALMSAAAHATQVVNQAAMNLNTTVEELEAAAHAAQAEEAAAQAAARKAARIASTASNVVEDVGDEAAAGKPAARAGRPPSEWDQYVATAGPDGGATNRMDTPEAFAESVRLSLQYNQAVAAAQASGRPIEPEWETWVARIPEHHKAALLKAQQQQKP